MIKRKPGHREIISRMGTGGFCPVRSLAVIAISFASALVAAAQNNLSPSEQTQIIERAREVASGTRRTCRVLSAPRQSAGLNYQNVHRQGRSWIRLPWMLRSRIKVSDTICSRLMESLPRRVLRKSEPQGTTLSLEPCFSGSSGRSRRQSSIENDPKNCADGQRSCSRTASKRTTRNS